MVVDGDGGGDRPGNEDGADETDQAARGERDPVELGAQEAVVDGWELNTVEGSAAGPG